MTEEEYKKENEREWCEIKLMAAFQGAINTAIEQVIAANGVARVVRGTIRVQVDKPLSTYEFNYLGIPFVVEPTPGVETPIVVLTTGPEGRPLSLR